jgi:hypothetical protein
MRSDESPIRVRSALEVSRILWPEFVEEHGCVFWLSDEALHTAADPSFRNALIYDTSRLSLTSRQVSNAIN